MKLQLNEYTFHEITVENSCTFTLVFFMSMQDGVFLFLFFLRKKIVLGLSHFLPSWLHVQETGVDCG